MKQPAPDDAEVEALLRRPRAPLPDDGFAARVLAALPPPEPAGNGARLRTMLILVGLIAGTVFAVAHRGPWAESARAWASLHEAAAQLAAALGDGKVMLGLALAGACLFFALARPRAWWRLRPLLRLR